MQVVNQVSIITDNNTQPIDTLECNNIVIDPKIISINDFKYIIDQILKDVVGDVDEYNFVVYNVSFEKSRLNEMKILINEQEYNEKVDKIVKNLFDLANYFDIRKKECIYVWSLKGYYSIKKVLDMIMKEQPHIFNLTGCKNYKQLKIGNGLQAQSASTLRFFDRITTNQWKEKVDDLKIYCENDVRAMIAVEQWIKMMINSQEKTKIIEPSLLPLLNSGAKEAHEKIIKLKEAGIEQFHYDVMEMGFVKNTSFDDEYLKFLWDNDLLANIHLMVLAPLEYIKKYAKYKPNSITFHVETQSISESIQLLELIRQYNIKSGISIKYSSKLEQYEELIPYCDYINIMSVEPGKGGQTFDEKCLENLEQANKYKDQYPFLTIQNDGGMNLQLAEKYFHLINNFIMGSFVFNDIDNVNEIIAKFNSFN